MALQPHQQRVVDEKTELDDKRTKLLAFIESPKFAELPDAERGHLARQADVMREYSIVLGKRIAGF